MNEALSFEPDWVSPPGETIADILEERKMSIEEFAERLQVPSDAVGKLIAGRTPITLKIARDLEGALGGSTTFWMSRDFRFRQNASRLLKEEGDWLQELPVRDMCRWGWIPERSRPEEDLSACLSFFGVRSVGAWRVQYEQVCDSVAFKTSRSLDSKPEAVAAWLRKGEIQARQAEAGAWSETGFRAALGDVRALTTKKDPSHFLPALKRLCAAHGVAVEVVRAPAGCRASGATRFLSDRKAMLLLSYRHRTFDHFWFSFFHEAGHLLLHDRSLIFLDGLDAQDKQLESEADQFAEDFLLPGDAHDELCEVPKNAMSIIRFAKDLGVSPGIVVGQMEHRGLVRHGRFARLKRKFDLD
ncbi:MAG: ImmA/IrrE family metallo-endopeptidase [Planctomycetes bacterium]|nr:ImmA/IrrE family metallo-endopeptidase [Planctomycetota bacterium]